MKHLLVTINFHVADIEHDPPVRAAEVREIAASLTSERIPEIREVCAGNSHIVAELEFTPYYAAPVNRNSAARVLCKFLDACEQAAYAQRNSGAVSFTATASEIGA
jgi:hypothetical protein